jgi:hypothetical protein
VTVSARRHPDHPCAGVGRYFSSLLPDADAGVTELVALETAARTAHDRNMVLDSRTLGNIAVGATHCVTSFPGEEQQLWGKLVAAFPADVARLLEGIGVHGCEALSLACVWTRRPGDAWWGLWTANVLKAVARGQVLVVCSRRDWERRNEPARLAVPAAENRSWPGVPIDLREGAPIEEYGTAQRRG